MQPTRLWYAIGSIIKKKIDLYRLVFYYSFSSYKFSSSDQPILQTHQLILLGIDGNYTNWSDWSNCSKDCEGLQGRYRLCIRPAPDGLGKNCGGNGSETKICGNTCQDGKLT